MFLISSKMISIIQDIDSKRDGEQEALGTRLLRMIIKKKLLHSLFASPEELCKSQRVLHAEAEVKVESLLNLHNSSGHIQPSAITAINYLFVLFSGPQY